MKPIPSCVYVFRNGSEEVRATYLGNPGRDNKWFASIGDRSSFGCSILDAIDGARRGATTWCLLSVDDVVADAQRSEA